MKNILSWALITMIIMGTYTLHAARPFIVRNDKKRMVVNQLTADAKGKLSYKTGRITAGMKPGEYIYARIPAPKELRDASSKYRAKKYKDAVTAFEDAYKKYRYLGWNTYCVYYAAKSLDALGKKNDALTEIRKLMAPPADPESESFYLKAKQLEASILIEQGETKDAEIILKELAKGNDTESAMFANNAKGDILTNQGKESEALFFYMRNVILFTPDNSKESQKGLARTVEILKAQNDPRAEEFEKMK